VTSTVIESYCKLVLQRALSEMERRSDSESSTESPRPKTPDAESRRLTVDVVWVGNHYRYNIPSFSCIVVELRHVKIRWWNLKAKRHFDYDVFMQEDAAICDVAPATAVVKNACFVDVSFIIDTIDNLSTVL